MEFTEEEVKQKLYELGYKDVPRSKLLEFMNDLKELIAHEQTYGTDYTTSSEVESSYQLSETSACQNITRDDEPQPLQDRNKRRSSAFSKQKSNPKFHSRRPILWSNQPQIRDRYAFMGKENLPEYLSEENTSSLLSSSRTSFDYLHYNKENISADNSFFTRKVKRKVARKENGSFRVFDETFGSSVSDTRDITDMENRFRHLPLNDKEISESVSSSSESSYTSRPSSTRHGLPAFIRPSHPHTKRLRKCDPVQRYHQFREEWKNNKVPGESNHSTLRWSIREQMLNCEVFEKPRHHYQSNDYVVPTEKKRQALRWQVRSALART